jgi:hypothetical protein
MLPQDRTSSAGCSAGESSDEFGPPDTFRFLTSLDVHLIGLQARAGLVRLAATSLEARSPVGLNEPQIGEVILLHLFDDSTYRYLSR